MTTSEPMVTLSAGLFRAKHVVKIGPALWEFAVLIDWQTDRSGLVRGGRPVRCLEIAERLGRDERTIRENIHRLKDAGYITVDRHPYGLILRVLNPKKWFRRPEEKARSRAEENTRTENQTGKKRPIQTGRNDPPERKKTPGVLKGKIKQYEAGGDPSRSAPPPESCSHQPACSNLPYHKAQVIAAAQGAAVPRKPGRWMTGADMLTQYSDQDLTEFVKWKRAQNPRRWEGSALLPQFVAEDFPVWLSSRKGNGRGPGAMTEAELQRLFEGKDGVVNP